MQFQIDIQNKNIGFRDTTNDDIDFVLAAERHPENACYVAQWSRETHLGSFENADQAHWLIYSLACQQPVGYIIMTGFEGNDRCIYLKRLVITDKGKGYGREALQLVKKTAFEQFQAHRLWLDVMVENEKARHLYRSEGFIEEGILRENAVYKGQFLSHAIMSILEQEYNDREIPE